MDPTCGQALAEIGYDRDFAELQAAAGQAAAVPAAASRRPAAAGGPRARLAQRSAGPQARQVRLANGAQLDLGATAKAWAADQCASSSPGDSNPACWSAWAGTSRWPGPRPAEAGGCGSPTTTPPGRGAGADGDDTFRRDCDLQHHGAHLDRGAGASACTTSSTRPPRPAVSCWRTVSVTAWSCVDANTASTAAIIRSEAALAWLQEACLPSRLVRQDGTVETTAGWPSDPGPDDAA